MHQLLMAYFLKSTLWMVKLQFLINYIQISQFLCMTKRNLYLTSEENTDSPPGMSEVNKLKSVSYKGKRGFLLQVPIYGKDKKTIVGYARFP